MARNIQDINPGDVFPPRNLPDSSENWGRVVENRIIALEKAYLSGEQGISGQNRNTAATLEALARQVDEISDTQQLLIQTESFQTDTTGTFGVNAATYDVVLTQRIIIPEGFDNVDLVTIGSAHARNQSGVNSFFYGVIAVDGVYGVSVIDGPIWSTGLGEDSYGTVSLGDARTLTGVEGTTVDVTVSVKNSHGSTDWPTESENTAKLSILALYRH
jgi:hypothetical protein